MDKIFNSFVVYLRRKLVLSTAVPPLGGGGGLLLLLILTACEQSQYRSESGMTWGTVYHITYNSAEDLRDSIVAEMRKIDETLSPFVEDSQISRVNRGEPGLVVDPNFRDVFTLSQEVCSLSHGAFDPTVAPLINLWGFGYRNIREERPTQEMIHSALLTVGIRDCYLAEDGTVVKKSPATEFNFSAIAKGYGVDKVAQMLERNGCTDYMVEIGGEIALAGHSPRGDKWNIQIDAPTSGVAGHERIDVISLTDRCVATSGNYRNHRDTSEGEVWHTINPVTGYPAVTRTLSATILAPTTALADALATSAMAMEPDSAMVMLGSIPSVSALLVLSTPADTFQIRLTPTWP